MENQKYLNAKKRVQDFFDVEISFYVLPDIERLTNEIRPDSNGQRGCTIPLAMMLFSVIDFLGFLMRDDENANKKHTYKNFHYLLSKSGYFPRIYSENKNCEKIVELFRHGIIHQFFSKASAVTKEGLKKPLIFEEMSGKTKIPILNVDVLSNDLVDVIAKIKEDINKDKEDNVELILRMNSRLDLLVKEDYEALNELT
jgi:hypothetical protein